MRAYIALIGLAACVSSASAITMSYSSYSGGSGVVNYDGTSANVGIGLLTFNISGGGTLTTVCAGLGQNLDSGYHTYTSTLAGGTGTSNVDLAAHIVAAHWSDATTLDSKTALQLAVWEALKDGSTNGATADFTSGNFYYSGISNSVKTIAMSFYTAATTTSGFANHYSAGVTGSQDQLSPVPEPTSLAALGLGLAALIRRKRKSA